MRDEIPIGDQIDTWSEGELAEFRLAAVERNILLAELRTSSELSEREGLVVDLTVEGFTQEEIGDRVGVSQGRVAQIVVATT